jgi:gamma-glutamyl:cysteine ligase YbdK (ATP-grasp superfamily)
MICQQCQKLENELRHILRRMEHQAADYSDKKCNSAVISMFDRATQYKRERDDARRENGELRAKVALLSQMLEDRCA